MRNNLIIIKILYVKNIDFSLHRFFLSYKICRNRRSLVSKHIIMKFIKLIVCQDSIQYNNFSYLFEATYGFNIISTTNQISNIRCESQRLSNIISIITK